MSSQPTHSIAVIGGAVAGAEVAGVLAGHGAAEGLGDLGLDGVGVGHDQVGALANPRPVGLAGAPEAIGGELGAARGQVVDRGHHGRTLEARQPRVGAVKDVEAAGAEQVNTATALWTRPRSEISPVMATSPRARRFERAETMALTSVTPAEGPSFGTAPAGTWRWISQPSKSSRSRPSASALARTQESAASADSRMTSPS